MASSKLLGGVEKLPQGKRKVALRTDILTLIRILFGNRILAFDYEDALNYATMTANTQAKGVSVSLSDGQIAAIALSHGFTVATRDESPFIAAGVSVINPWLT